jgi:hypothetical protein
MRFSTSKGTKSTAIVITILLLSSFVLMLAPVQAQEDDYVTTKEGTYPYLPAGETPDYTIDTIAFLSFRPNPIGVGQSLLVNAWVAPGLYHAFAFWDLKVTIEKPDGTTQEVVMDSYYGDATLWFEITPDQAGTWRFKFECPGLYIPAPQVYEDHPLGSGFMGPPDNRYHLETSVYYTPCETDWQELEVIDEIVYPWPVSELPTDYWDRPVNSIHREWYPIIGNYPWTGTVYYMNSNLYSNPRYQYTAYVEAPNTAHVMWKRQNAFGGLIGGEEYYISELSGGGTPSIIFMGRCYQGMTKTFEGEVTNVIQCYDLRTGEIYWEQPAGTYTSERFGRISVNTLVPTNIVYERSTSEAVPGAVASRGTSIYLVAVTGGRLYKWDPWTGSLSQNISLPVSSGTIVKNDEVLSVQSLDGEYRLINWSMTGSSSNFAGRVLSNITWPWSSLGTGYDLESGIAFDAWWNTPPGPQWCIGYQFTTADLFTGEILAQESSNDTLTTGSQNAQTWIAANGLLAVGCHGRHYTCWNARTGELEWTSELSDYPWGSWWPYNMASYDFNETTTAIITSTYEGVYAINMADGNIIWHYQDPHAVPFENPYTTEDGHAATPFFTGVKIADGKIYAYNGEHTASQPAVRDWKLHCINADTGELIWQILNPMTPGAMADGYLTASDPYDGHMYVFGQGESETTVTASPKTVGSGSAVLIEGTVLDLSPAQAGTPCVSADSMTTQMEYLHMATPIDGIWHNETITGVPVTLTAIRSDGEVFDLGTTTTDGYYGNFYFAWTPDSQGTYEIVATFEGDDSYGSSAAACAVHVGSATTSSPASAIEVEQTAPFLTTETAILLVVAAIVAIGVAAFWSLKRK